MRKSVAFAALLASLLLLPGCALLEQAAGGLNMPTMTYQNALLVRAPSTSRLLAYYCPAAVSAIACTPILGAAPAKEDLRFDFELGFKVDNPSSVPIPTLSMLLATTLFQDDPDITELGATCVKFCDPGDPTCTGVGAEDACAAGDQPELDSLDDFIGSATDQLVNVATGDLDAVYGDNLGIRTIPAHGSQDLKVVFSLGVDPMTDILGRVSSDYVSNWLAGSEQPVDVPYSVRGTLWVDVPLNVGRYGLPFGPQASVWQLDM